MRIKHLSQTLLIALLFMLIGTTAKSQQVFNNNVYIPPYLDAANFDTIRLKISEQTHNFNPADFWNDTIYNGVQTWAYNMQNTNWMSVLGPALGWHTGETVNMIVKNELSEPTTTHWHGAEVPAYYDGGPHQPIQPDSTWVLSFTNLDSACTMWYHPHLHNKTVQHVSKGLSGVIYSEQASDQLRQNLPHTYAVDDFPIIISDMGFDTNVDANNDTTYTLTIGKGKRPTNVVNGVINPYIWVPNAMVRFRILNASTRKAIQFGWSDTPWTADTTSLNDFTLIATDGGYTMEPENMRTMRTGPGGRDEIVLDFSNYQPGDRVYLRNLKELMPAGQLIGSVGSNDTTAGNAFLEIRMVDRNLLGYQPILSAPQFTNTWDPSIADTVGVNIYRTKNLVGAPHNQGGSGFTINDTPFDMMHINDVICEGSKEIWTIHNQTTVAHPFHIHKIFFRVLDITDENGNNVPLEPLGLNGPKDDVLVLPGWKLRFLAKFDGYPSAIAPQNSYMYHCHILTHEDSLGGGMMAQFVVTDDPSCVAVSDKEEIVQDIPMSVFPNPTTSQLFMEGSSAEDSNVQLVDLSGRILREQQLAPFDGVVQINIDDIPTGMYMLIWRTADGVGTRKVVISE